MTDTIFNRVLIVGLGLIGGSFARCLKEKNLCQQVLGVSRSPQTVAKALQLQIIDQGSSDLQSLSSGLDSNDLIFIAAPVLAMGPIFANLQVAAKNGVTITDGGSVKAQIIDAARLAMGEVPACFVPGHPIAGSEKSGVESGFATLFEGRKTILTPLETTPEHLVQKVSLLWEAMGSTVVTMSYQEHDRILAATSHLPHLLAYTLVDLLSQSEDGQAIFQFAAGGFKDFSRIAASDPVMWHDIVLSNKEALLNCIDGFTTHLSHIRQAIDDNNGEALLESFQRAKKNRDHFEEIYNESNKTN